MSNHGYHWESALGGVFAPCTPSDSLYLTKSPCAGIYVGGAGDVTVEDMDGTTPGTLFKNVAAGQILPIKVRKVFATGTTATNIVLLY